MLGVLIGSLLGALAILLAVRPSILDWFIERNRETTRGRKGLTYREMPDEWWERTATITHIVIPVIVALMALACVGQGLGWLPD